MAPSPYDLSCWWDVKHKHNNNINNMDCPCIENISWWGRIMPAALSISLKMKKAPYFFSCFSWWAQQHTWDYCKSGNFRENFIFANSVKRHIWGVKNSRLGHDLPASVNNSGFDILRGFHFHMRSFVKIKPSRKFPNLRTMITWW